MPDMDTPQISGILEEHAPPPAAGGGGVVGVQQASKRPRDDGSPVRGKRGRGENGDISLSLKIPVPVTSSSPSVPSSSSPASPPWVPPLCESPSKINQANSPFAPYSGGAAAAKPPALAADDAVAPVAGPATAAVASATSRRKGRMPHAAPPSLGATDPIFHAALLRLLHSRNGDHCAEAVGWRWRGDTPARFDHWPCALHPSVMDLLACVSASEEQVVLTGCDKKHADSCNGGGGDDPPPPRREAAWRAPRPRTPWAHRGGQAALAAGATTPIAAPSPLPPPASAQTPLSALRRSGSSRRLPRKNRVRFSTHDMSVVDTPDPQRGGSAKGMMSALGGLESILSAAERIRELAAGGPGNSGGRERGGFERRGGGGGRQYEGYFDRFSAAAGGEPDDGGGGGGGGGRDDNNEQQGTAAAAGGLEKGSSGSDGGSQDEGSAAAAEGDDDEDVDAPLETEARSVREDSAAFVTVLEEIANGDAAPGEVALAGGWGPEHRNAAAFYAKELAFLCGTKTGVGGRGLGGPFVSGGSGAVGSHLRVRYLDVLSCLVRYNLKLLLNTCECEAPDEQQQELDNMDDDDQEDEEEHGQPQQAEDPHGNGNGNGEGDSDDDDDDDDDDVSDDENDDDSVPTANLPSPPSPTAAALSVIVPGRAALLRQQGLLDAAWGSSVTAQAATAERGLCGCVSVLDDKGALEFNTEDVAALLTLALGRVHPFMPLAARITVAAKEAGWDGCGDDGDEALDARVWAAVQEYTLECRRAAAAAASSDDAAAAATSPTHLFSSPSVAVATPPLLPVPVCRGRSSAAKAGGPSAGGAADKLPASDFAVKGIEGEAKAEAGSDGATAPVADLASPSVPGIRGSVSEDNGSAAGLELTVDESADLLEFVAAARFIAQLLAEPVVAAGVAGGRWSCAMRLSEQVRKLAEEEQQAQEEVVAATSGIAAPKTAPPASSLSNMLCLGALADVQGLGLAMAQQARYAPALEAALKKELRQALRGGQGLKRRIKHRLQPPGAPDVFSFPMITPACQLVHYEGGVGCV